MLSSSKSLIYLQKIVSSSSRCMGTQNFKWKPSKKKPNKRPKLPIILKEDFENLGRKWQLVPVERGYARNYLIPQGIAAYATPENLKKYEINLNAAGESNSTLSGASPKTVSFISNANLEILRPEHTQFEITEHYIAYGCKRVLGLYVPVNAITLPCIISRYGVYYVDITINGSVTVPLKVTIGKLEERPDFEEKTGSETLSEKYLDDEYDDEFLDPEMPEF